MTPLQRAARFFLEHAGYATPPGRVACALSLARAEARALRIGLSVEWEDDDAETLEPPLHGEARPALWLWARVVDEQGRTLASLGGIGLETMRDPYVRVVRAELFDEALARIDAERDADACAAARELAERHTYAAGAP